MSSVLGDGIQPKISLAVASSVLSGVAAASFLLGRWSVADACRAKPCGNCETPCEKDTSTCATGRRLPPEAQGKLSSDQLRSFLAQLQAKPIGPRGQHIDNAHSTAKIVLLCASGKGGVGKSTIALNLAYMMKGMDLEVGLLDLDIYGPSLPTLVRAPAGCVTQNEAGRIVPIDYGGVALMSWGYVNQDQANVIRAPIANQLTTQLLTMVEWGPLDVLIIDTPPGTGDVLLSIAQTLAVDGAVLVTTSNAISLADVSKGLDMFDKVDISPLLVIRNMAAVSCESCGHNQPLFSDGAISGLAEFLAERNCPFIDLPLDANLSQAPLSYQPAMTYSYPFARNPLNEARPAWLGLSRASRIVLEIALGLDSSEGVGHHREALATLRMRRGGLLEVRLRGGELRPVSCGVLRAACRCAHCVDEFTGEIKIDQEKIRNDGSIRAKSLELVGNYAVSVLWADGHQTIVANRALVELTGGQSPALTKKDAPGGTGW